MEHLGTLMLESDRLKLRKCMESDYKDAYKYCYSDQELCRLQGFNVHENEQITRICFKEKEERYKKDMSYYQWSVVRKEDNQFIGEVGLILYNEKYNAIQVGYHLGKKFRGNGYMQEALKTVLKFAFEELNIDQVYALILKENVSSQKTVLSNGFDYSRTLENYKDEIYEGPIEKFKITKEKWFEINKEYKQRYGK